MTGTTSLNYWLNLPENPIKWKSTSTLPEDQDTQWKIASTLIENPKSNEVVMDQETIDKIYWDKEKIIAYLKTNCLTPKKWEESEHVKEFSWEKWTHHSLILPSVNWFKCKKLDWFISDKEYRKDDFEDINYYEKLKNWDNNSRDSEVIANALLVMRDFLWALWVSLDEDIEYFEKEFFMRALDTWQILMKIANLKDVYWLKTDQKHVTQLNCLNDVFCWTSWGHMASARLFKLSVSEIG